MNKGAGLLPWLPRWSYAASVGLLLSAVSLHASFELPLNSVRSSALGSTSMAGSPEAVGLFMNPASLALLSQKELSLIYNQLYLGLSDVPAMSQGSLALGIPLEIGTFGLGLGDLHALQAKEERTLALSFSKSLLSRRLHLGLAAKHLFHSYRIGSDPMAQSDPVFAKGTSKSAFSFDLGLSAQLLAPVSLGLAVRNANQPDIGLASPDKVQREAQASLAVHLPGIGLQASGDLFYRSQGTGIRPKTSPLVPYFGLEKMLLAQEGLALRLGANPLEFTGGFGIRLGRTQLDYALIIPRNLALGEQAGTHRLGVTLRFGEELRRVRREEEESFYSLFFEE